MTDEHLTTLARNLVRQLINIGAACQKAGSFSVAKPGTPQRSVYNVYAEEVRALLRKEFHT